MILWAVHRSPGICLTAEVGPHSTSGREKEGNKERVGSIKVIIKVQGRIIQARFIEIHQVFEKKRSDTFLTE